VLIFSIECCKEIGGDSRKDNNTNIQNLFINARSKYLLYTNYMKNWYVYNDMQYASHPQSIAPSKKAILLTLEMHQKFIEDHISTMEKISDSLEDAKKPFTKFRFFKDSTLKSFWMKVQCFYSCDLLSLCLLKKNLESNLCHHLASSKPSKPKNIQLLPRSNSLQFLVDKVSNLMHHQGLVFILTNLILNNGKSQISCH